jgi:hypothetical protein
MSKPRVSPKELVEEIEDARFDIHHEPCIRGELALDLHDSRAAVAELVEMLEVFRADLTNRSAPGLQGAERTRQGAVRAVDALIAKHKVEPDGREGREGK